MEFVPLIYYSLGISILTALHTEFHRREWPKCKACRSHSYLLSIVIGVIALVIGIISISLMDNVSHPYWWIFFMLTFIGTLSVFPLYSIGQKPILISSKSLWLFCSLLGSISSANIILIRIYVNNPSLFKYMTHPIMITGIFTGSIIFFGYFLVRLLSPGKIRYSQQKSPISGSDVILEKMFIHGELYIIVSLLYIFLGILTLIIVPLITGGAELSNN